MVWPAKPKVLNEEDIFWRKCLLAPGVAGRGSHTPRTRAQSTPPRVQSLSMRLSSADGISANVRQEAWWSLLPRVCPSVNRVRKPGLASLKRRPHGDRDAPTFQLKSSHSQLPTECGCMSDPRLILQKNHSTTPQTHEKLIVFKPLGFGVVCYSGADRKWWKLPQPASLTDHGELSSLGTKHEQEATSRFLTGSITQPMPLI